MTGNIILRYGIALPALLAIGAVPAFAEGKTDRARAAIAEAQGKIDAANKLGTAGDVPRLQAQAQAALRTAQEALANHKKDDAIVGAHRASELADTAIGESQRARADRDRNQRADAQAATAAAQEDAAAANARAQSAEQAAAAAAADAAAARATPAPVVIAAAPAPTTTVTTETVKATAPVATKRATVHRVVRKTTARPAVSEKTTTTVTTTPN